MTLRPLFYSDQDCRDRLKPGKPMFWNVYHEATGGLVLGLASISRRQSDMAAWAAFRRPPYRIVVKAKPTPSPEKEDAA